jgi:hypothetical protein
MLKFEINKEAFDALSEDVKKEYKAEGESFKLSVEGYEDVGPLKRALDRERDEKKGALGKLKEAETKLAVFESEQGSASENLKTLEKSWKDKHEAQKAEFESKLGQKDSFINNMLVENKAAEIATKISTSPNLILPHIRSRLTADLTGEVPTTKVLDKEGKISAMSLDELSKEFVDNKDFAPIIVGNKSSGSGASGGKTTTTPSGAGDGSVDLSKMSPKELANHLNQPTE